jgi:hypothetical protein
VVVPKLTKELVHVRAVLAIGVVMDGFTARAWLSAAVRTKWDTEAEGNDGEIHRLDR